VQTTAVCVEATTALDVPEKDINGDNGHDSNENEFEEREF
jgi:hypothetical protein